MNQPENNSLSCEAGFFFDETVNNCLPCERVCGGNGLDQLECNIKCRDFVSKPHESTTSAMTAAMSKASGMEIWVFLAAASVGLAVFTITIVAVVVWRYRRMAKAIPPSDGEERLMRPSNITDDGNSPYNTERGQSTDCLSVSRRPFVCVNSSIYLPNANYTFSPIKPSQDLYIKPTMTLTDLPNPTALLNLNEDNRRTVMKSYSQVFQTQDYSDRNSPVSQISLKSDLSLADIPYSVSFSSGQKCFDSQHSGVSSIYDMFHMFGWLNKTDWVMDYREDAGGLHIGVEGIGKSVAEETIRKKGQRLPDFQFVVTSPTKGRYVPCPHTSRQTSAFVQNMGIPAKLKPGSVIFSTAMEPESDAEESLPGHAIYSGSLGGNVGEDTGITVGHLFAHEHLELSVNTTPVGLCFKKFGTVHHRSLKKITADLALLRISLPTENTVNFEGRNYKLRLFKGELNAKSASRIPVMVFRSDGSFCEGVIAESMFTFKRCGLFNTLRIVCSEDNPQKVSNEGDSGTLVLSLPTSSSGSFLDVYGMVIGYWVSNDQSCSHTVATRLWNVLETLSAESELDFSCKNASTDTEDSGFFTAT